MPEAAPPEPPANPYLPQLQERRHTWQRQRLTDYVFVFDEHVSLFSSPARESLRIVVRDGRVVEARSLLYGGSAKLERVPTMDELFDRAEQYASYGPDGIAASFSVEYDDAQGTLSQVSADGRLEIADDEVSFRVRCFSADLDGCRPALLSKAMCRKAGGWVAAVSGDICERNGWSIGLVSQRELCCRTFSTPERDELTSAQCKAAGGQEQSCGIADVHVGSSGRRGAYCCRRLVE